MNELVLTPLKQKLCCVSMEYRLKSVKAEDTFNRDQAQEFNCLTLVRACAQAFNSPLPGTITQAWMSKVCAHMCTYMQVCIHVCGAAISQRSMLGIFLSFSVPCFLRQRHSLSLNLGVTHSTRLTGQQPPGPSHLHPWSVCLKWVSGAQFLILNVETLLLGCLQSQCAGC